MAKMTKVMKLAEKLAIYFSVPCYFEREDCELRQLYGGNVPSDLEATAGTDQALHWHPRSRIAKLLTDYVSFRIDRLHEDEKRMIGGSL